MHPPLSDRESLLALHAAVEIEPLWRAINALLRDFIPCRRVTLFLGHIGMHEASKVYTDPPLESPDRDYFARRAEQNPFNSFIERNVGTPYYRFSDVVGPPETFCKTRFYREFARAEGWDKGLSGLIWVGQELRGMFSLYRAPEAPDFDREAIRTLEALLPHISIAIDRVQRLHRERLYRTVLEDFNRNMPVGLLLLNWDLQLIYANTEAMRLVAAWNFGPEASKRFNPREVFELPPRLLEECGTLRERIIVEGKEEVRALGKSPVAVADAPPGISCSIQPISLPSSNIANPGFFITFEGQAGLGAEKAEPISREKILLLNQLSPSERELALLVGEGLSNKEIAQRLNKSVLTVKKQLNSAFGKLNIGNRARLIALLH